MRNGFACLVACLFAGPALAEDLAPMPDFFQKSWEAAAARPLKLMSLSPAAPTTRSIVPLAAPVKASLQPVDDLPAVMTNGLLPPARRVPGTTAAFAAPDDGAPVRIIPQPVPRPGGIDQRMTSIELRHPKSFLNCVRPK